MRRAFLLSFPRRIRYPIADPVVTRARTLAFIAFPLGPTVGKLLAVPRLSVLILGTWVLCASLSIAVLSVEILRATIPRWSTWTRRIRAERANTDHLGNGQRCE
jgi:hypothetical protein